MISIGIITGLIYMLAVGIGDFLQSIPTRKIGRFKTLFARHFLTLLFILPFGLFLYSKGELTISITNILWLMFGTIFFLFGYINFLKAFEIGNVSVVSPISAAYSIVTVILSIIFLKEFLSIKIILSIGIIMLGIVLTTTDLAKHKNLQGAAGVKESIIAMFLWGVYFFIVGYAGQTTEATSLFVAVMMIQVIFFLTFVYFKKSIPKFSELRENKLLLIFISIVPIYLIAWASYNYGVTKDMVSIVAPIGSLYPAITVLLASLIYKEKLVLNQKIGILILLVGLFLISIN